MAFRLISERRWGGVGYGVIGGGDTRETAEALNLVVLLKGQ